MPVKKGDLTFELAVDPETERMRAALVSIGDELDKQLQQVANINAAMDPRVIRERVALERQVTEQKIAYGRAVERERTVQAFQRAPVGALIQSYKQGGLSGVGSTLSTAGAEMGGIGGGALAGLGAAAGALSMVGGAAMAAAGFVKELAQGMLGFVAAANPAIAMQFQLILRDISGVIGQTLIPIFKVLMEVFRVAGDVIATILPSGEEMETMMEGFNEAFGELTDGIRAALAEIGPPIRELIMLLGTALFNGLGVLIKIVTETTKALMYFVRPFLALLHGLGLTSGTVGTRSFVGAAARNASISGLEEFRTKLQTSAFSSGIAAGRSPAERMADKMDDIDTRLESWQSPSGPIALLIGMILSGDTGPANFTNQTPFEPIEDPFGVSTAVNAV